MTDNTDCKLMSVQAAKVDVCYHFAYHMYEEAQMLEHYWYNIVEYHGGDELAPYEEVTSKEQAEWTYKGTMLGLYELFNERFTEDGVPLETCVDIFGNSSWGDDCAGVKSTYKGQIQIGDLTVYTSKPTLTGTGAVDHTCHTDDSDILPTVTGEELCSLAEKENGMYQFKFAASITCTDPSDFSSYTGPDDCEYFEGNWRATRAYANYDSYHYRTLGSEVGREVVDTNIHCLAKDGHTELLGS